MTRYNEPFDATDLEQNDRINPQLVARFPGQLDEPITRAMQGEPDAPDTQLLVVTELKNHDDVHSALLLDEETQTFVRASRHDSNQAWTQAEADWTVREVGGVVAVADAEVESRPDNEMGETEQEYMTTWIDVLFNSEIKTGNHDIGDQRKLEGSSLYLYDPWDGREGYATVELVD